MRASATRWTFIVALSVGASCLAQAQDGVFIVLDDEASIREFASVLGSGDGTVSVDTNDAYPHDDDGEAALRIDSPAGDNQKFNANIPGWAFEIVGRPQAEDEFRYITFAWRKEGAPGIQLQLSAQPGGWSHRYHAHANLKGWNPSIRLTLDEPSTWQVHTRDLFRDWGGMVVTGMALTPGSGEYGLFDHIAFHQSPEDPFAAPEDEPGHETAVQPAGKSATVWARIKHDTL
jgi:hypothetical protein